MKLDEASLNELVRRCDLAISQTTFKEQMDTMGNWMSVDSDDLPPRVKSKFREALTAIARTTILGPSK